MVVRCCLFKDVPIPKYRLGDDGRLKLFWIVMIFMYCVSHSIQGMSILEASMVAWSVVFGGITIMQLTWPAEDFISNIYMFPIALLAISFALLGAARSLSWFEVIIYIFLFGITIEAIAELESSLPSVYFLRRRKIVRRNDV
ncbi:unnamed protein product [Cochlearia groenlandica]